MYGLTYQLIVYMQVVLKKKKKRQVSSVSNLTKIRALFI